MPEIRASFLVILALIAFSFGVRSAVTKFCASEATSTPEPAFKDLISPCAAALLAAAAAAAVVEAEVELATVVAIRFVCIYCLFRIIASKLKPFSSNT